MTITTIIEIIVVAIAGLILAGLLFRGYAEEKSIGLLAAGISTVIVAIGICAILVWVQLFTEAGKREYKTQQSNFNGGITRRLNVYDMEGDLIQSYTGKFDIEFSDGRVLFDDENGLRHTIYFTTGTITVDELAEE